MINIHKKTNEWMAQNLLSEKQKEKIIAYEQKTQTPFRMLSWLWLGIFVLCLGITSFIAEYWEEMSHYTKLTIVGILVAIGIGGIIYGFRKEKNMLLESALFFTFLVIGGAIGLIAQIFNLPVGTGEGLLMWAVLSLIIVLLSERAFLSLLWIPLFLGGILGYLRLELLFLFLSTSPVATVSVLATLFFIIIYLTGSVQVAFLRSLHFWSIGLFYLALFLGERSIPDPIMSFGLSVFFLGLLVWYAFATNRIRLFNLTLFLMAIRFMWLYLQLFGKMGHIGMWLFLSGGIVLVGVGLSHLFINSEEDKR